MAGERFVEIMQAAAVGAVGSMGMADITFGKVTSIGPLKIKIGDRLEIGAALLIVPEHLTDHDIKMRVLHATEQSGSPAHSHAYSGEKTFTILNGLKVNDKVVMIRAMGGQKYLIVDRAVEK